ncbi:hypothetical protein KIPB_004838 [Kipferlia bialata]|uniref:Protein kinase domain-containing protein n=1 Tax=Kipferlia bialata TaxID=797122 RepID=A0A391NLH3_9EUKA|nr:hypothetical protein KIPB_004838 [Kipferlia bialata]|eukprot:g4838.t1
MAPDADVLPVLGSDTSSQQKDSAIGHLTICRERPDLRDPLIRYMGSEIARLCTEVERVTLLDSGKFQVVHGDVLPLLPASTDTSPCCVPFVLSDVGPFSDAKLVLGDSQLRALFARSVRGLYTLHRSGIVHNDIHRGNIIVVPDETGSAFFPVFLDFEAAYIVPGHSLLEGAKHALLRDMCIDMECEGDPFSCGTLPELSEATSQFYGVLTYASRDTHAGVRDSILKDLEALVYSFAVAAGARLPWVKECDCSDPDYMSVYQMKLSLAADVVRGIAPEGWPEWLVATYSAMLYCSVPLEGTFPLVDGAEMTPEAKIGHLADMQYEIILESLVEADGDAVVVPRLCPLVSGPSIETERLKQPHLSIEPRSVTGEEEVVVTLASSTRVRDGDMSGVPVTRPATTPTSLERLTSMICAQCFSREEDRASSVACSRLSGHSPLSYFPGQSLTLSNWFVPHQTNTDGWIASDTVAFRPWVTVPNASIAAAVSLEALGEDGDYRAMSPYIELPSVTYDMDSIAVACHADSMGRHTSLSQHLLIETVAVPCNDRRQVRAHLRSVEQRLSLSRERYCFRMGEVERVSEPGMQILKYLPLSAVLKTTAVVVLVGSRTAVEAARRHLSDDLHNISQPGLTELAYLGRLYVMHLDMSSQCIEETPACTLTLMTECLVQSLRYMHDTHPHCRLLGSNEWYIQQSEDGTEEVLHITPGYITLDAEVMDITLNTISDWVTALSRRFGRESIPVNAHVRRLRCDWDLMRDYGPFGPSVPRAEREQNLDKAMALLQRAIDGLTQAIL